MIVSVIAWPPDSYLSRYQVDLGQLTSVNFHRSNLEGSVSISIPPSMFDLHL